MTETGGGTGPGQDDGPPASSAGVAPLVGALDPPPPAPDQRASWAGDTLPEPPRQPTPLRPAWLAAGAVAAVVTDLSLRHFPWNNVAGTLLIAALVAGLAASGFIRTRASRVMLAGALFFGLFLTVRTEPILTGLNILAAFSLLTIAAVHGQGRSFWDLRPMRICADGGMAIVHAVSGIIEIPEEVGARYRVAKERAEATSSGTAYGMLRGLAMAIPIVLVFGVLLASADVVFQSFFSGFGSLNPGVLVGHAMLMAIGAYAMMLLIRLAASQGATDPIQRSPSLGHIEAGVVLVSVNLLFATFAVAQLMTILGGAREALDRAGLDSKQFARQGFFQLLWVAGLTLCLVMALHVATAENVKATRITRALSLVTVTLTMVIVVVAITRIGFYIDDGGQTPLRLYSAVFSIWVALAFVFLAIRIWGVRPLEAWLLPVLLASGLVVLGGLNVVNPEAVIANDNIERDHDALYWHVVEGQFSGDGQAVLAADIDDLSPELGAKVASRLCLDHESAQESGFLDFNVGRWRARNALDDLCG